MPVFQGKRFRFAQDSQVARAGAGAPTRPGEGKLRRKLKRTLVLGLTLTVPLFVFSLLHPAGQGANPISRADAAAALEGDAVAGEPSTFITAGSRIRTLARLAADVDASTGEMRELYGVGTLAGADATLRLEVRSHVVGMRPAGFFASVADATTKMGVIVRKLGVQQDLATPRGALEWADMILSTNAGPKSCLAFRVAPSDDKRLTGLLCGPNGMRPDVAALGCVVERLEFSKGALSAGFDSLLHGGASLGPACRAAVI